MNDDGSFEIAKILLGIALVAILVVAVGVIWISGIALGILVVIVLVALAGTLGLSAGSSPTSITSGSFVFLYLRTLFREFPVALRRVVRPTLIVVGLWYFFSLGWFFSLVISKMERTGEPDLSGFSGWISDTTRVAIVLFVVIALYQLRQTG